MTPDLQVRLEDALRLVETALADHDAGLPAPFSKQVLQNVAAELNRMAADPAFKPGYPRFLLDWPDDMGLRTLLIDLAYRFDRARKKSS